MPKTPTAPTATTVIPTGGITIASEVVVINKFAPKNPAPAPRPLHPYNIYLQIRYLIYKANIALLALIYK